MHLAYVVRRLIADALQQQRLGEVVGLTEGVAEPALQRLRAQRRELDQGRLAAAGEVGDQLQLAGCLGGGGAGVTERRGAGGEELGEARAGLTVVGRPRPQRAADCRGVRVGTRGRRGGVAGGDLRRAAARDPDRQPAGNLRRRRAAGQTHHAHIGQLHRRRLQECVVSALRLDGLDGVRGPVPVALVDDVASGLNHSAPQHARSIVEQRFYIESGCSCQAGLGRGSVSNATGRWGRLVYRRRREPVPHRISDAPPP